MYTPELQPRAHAHRFCVVGLPYNFLNIGFSYHIKYMHIGDRDEIAQIISTLQLPLKNRLRFLCPSLISDRQIPHHPAPISTPVLPTASLAS